MDRGHLGPRSHLIALARSGTGAVQRELASLLAAGLVTVRDQGNQKHYQANAASPVFADLRGLVLKTVGLADVLRAALAPLASNWRQSCTTPPMNWPRMVWTGSNRKTCTSR